MNSIDRLDCTGCNVCTYDAVEKESKVSIRFWYNQCDEDGMTYSLGFSGLQSPHPALNYPMITTHEALENLIFQFFENVVKVNCSCDDVNEEE